ncbi:MAG TPA: S41 family peptidase [Vicinamibacterales bacterium]|nr:S41 family peptidase [Vicinamibacterales bacterium]
MTRQSRLTHVLAVAFVLSAGAYVASQAPQITNLQRGQARQMLRTIRTAIGNDYYDPAFHGLDLAEHFKTAEKKIDTVESIGRAYAVIAQALIDFGDSHTFFIPPEVPASYEYGWQMAIVGDRCLVLGVKPGSDAEAKGLRAGDRILEIETVPPSRADLFKMRYSLNLLNPRRRVRLLVATPGAAPRPLEIETKVTPRNKEVRIDFEDFVNGITSDFDEISVQRVNRISRLGSVVVWRLEDFGILPDEVDREFDAVVKGATDLIIDLRGNPGGYIKTLENLAGRLFDHDVKIADLKTRKSTKLSMAKKRKNPFMGRVIALVDSESGSAAEVFARVLQLEQRGAVLGDRTSGAVMVSEHMVSGIQLVSANDELRILPFAFSLTVADLIMKDGKSLERVGVVPDEALVPTQEDLAAGRDPVLARAATMLGATLDSAAAGKLFPLVWK